MNENLAERRVFPVDATHAGVRLSVLAASAIGLTLSFSWLNSLLANMLGLSGLAAVVAAVVGTTITTVALGYASEVMVKRLWPSGRTLEVDAEGLHLRSRRAVTSVKWSSVSEFITWQFIVSSSKTWVPIGWRCVATELSDGNASISFYTFISPGDIAKLANLDQFLLLAPVRNSPESNVDSAKAALARAAEQRRWRDGSEVDRKTMFAVLDLVNLYVGVGATNEHTKAASSSDKA